MSKKILIVDDEPFNLTLLEAILGVIDCETVRARNGLEAIEALRRGAYDVVLLDVMMPVMGGIEALKIIRGESGWPSLPVIIVTAAHDRDARIRGFEAGADEFLEKPIDRGLLLTRVQTLIHLAEARRLADERARAVEALHVERRELINLIVHDLKNPLAVIHTNLQYMRAVAASPTGDADEALQDALTASARMKGLILDILNVERMDQAQLSIRRQEVNVMAMVEEVTRAHRREAALHSLSLMTYLDIGKELVHADADLIRRVIENLLENALHHTPPRGSIELRVETDRELAIIVSNSGTPIPEELRRTLFGKFTRGEGETQSRFGLGLYFCQRVAEAHAGSIALVDRAGWPVTFRFAVPTA